MTDSSIEMNFNRAPLPRIRFHVISDEINLSQSVFNRDTGSYHMMPQLVFFEIDDSTARSSVSAFGHLSSAIVMPCRA